MAVMFKDVVRALRLPFISASVLPFVFGALIPRADFNFSGFILGLVAVAAAHLSANLINDYADSKSGADWQDTHFYKFFGGSKLIQEKVLSQGFYLKAAVLCAVISGLAVVGLALALNRWMVVWLYLGIIILSWLYSLKPLQFSYHRWGEVFIFILFGPAPVMGGYFIQSGIFPDLKSLMLSLPFGFLTTAILFANEVPDFKDDQKAQKHTWVSLCAPQGAFLLYGFLIVMAFVSMVCNVVFGYVNIGSLGALILLIPALKAARIIKKFPLDKFRLVNSSKLTIMAQSLVGLWLIAAALIWPKAG